MREKNEIIELKKRIAQMERIYNKKKKQYLEARNRLRKLREEYVKIYTRKNF